MSLSIRLVVAMLLCLAARAASAQEPRHPSSGTSWGLWGGMANNSPTNLWGAEGGRDIEVLAVRMAHPLRSSDRMTLELVLDFVPGAWVTMPRADSVHVATDCKGPEFHEGSCGWHPLTRTERAWGIGIAPLGFQARFRPHHRVQPYLSLSGGMLRFGERIPVPAGATLNFSVDAGTGLMIGMPRGLGLVAGYKFYHISNGGTARRNPGLDGHMLVVGVRGMGSGL